MDGKIRSTAGGSAAVFLYQRLTVIRMCDIRGTRGLRFPSLLRRRVVARNQKDKETLRSGYFLINEHSHRLAEPVDPLVRERVVIV